MEIELEKLEGCKRSVRITLPADRAEREFGELLESSKKNMRLPGFRRGKVPAKMIRQRFAAELRQEVISKLVPEALEEAIRKEKLQPVERPTLEDVSWDEGEPLRITASFEVRPQIDLQKYTGLAVSLDSAKFKIDDSQVEDQLDRLRTRSANFRPIEGRAAGAGDFALIDLRGEPEAEEAAPFRREGVLIAVEDSDDDGGFARNLVGAGPGQHLEFSISYPTDFADEALAGTRINYQVDLKELKERILPELDDEFARDLGQFEDLKQLRAEIRRQLEADAASQRAEEGEQKLFEQILEANEDFELPSVMVNRQMAAREEETRRQMVARGINPDHFGYDWSEFRKRTETAARFAVQRALLLDRIAELQSIKAPPKAVNAEIAAIAAARGEDQGELRRQMIADGSFDFIRRRVRDGAVVAWLLENNDVKEG